MKRIIDHYLLEWKHYRLRKSLLLRGARQIGKTFAVRKLGKTYESFVEINLEFELKFRPIFEETLDPFKIIDAISMILQKKIIPGKTLLFIDEIQAIPQAITALRYFYEMMPELHVIAAGSLLDFAIQKVGIPVGRVQALYMRPVSFIEYLAAINKPLACKVLHDNSDISEIEHQIGLKEVNRYLKIGGMPESLYDWMQNKSSVDVSKIHESILDSYHQDFDKYAKNDQVAYVAKVFNAIPQQMSNKFKFNVIDGDFRKRELIPALDLLITAGVALKVFYSAGQGAPLGAQSSDLDFKVLFLDVGLAQKSLGIDISDLSLQSEHEFINKGSLVEAFVGQELAAYACPRMKRDFYYWHKDSPPQAEIDYLTTIKYQVIPIEVKAGEGSTLHSMHYFLKNHEQSPYGIKFSKQFYSVLSSPEHKKIYSYPLYAVAKIIGDCNIEMKAAIDSLIAQDSPIQ